jgi:hypothetical protein
MSLESIKNTPAWDHVKKAKGSHGLLHGMQAIREFERQKSIRQHMLRKHVRFAEETRMYLALKLACVAASAGEGPARVGLSASVSSLNNNFLPCCPAELPSCPASLLPLCQDMILGILDRLRVFGPKLLLIFFYTFYLICVLPRANENPIASRPSAMGKTARIVQKKKRLSVLNSVRELRVVGHGQPYDESPDTRSLLCEIFQHHFLKVW